MKKTPALLEREILADYPIESNREDLLKRSSLAKSIAEMIIRYKGADSYVIGIEGVWGSGKSSFINMIIEEMGNGVHILKFNPWNFSDQYSLLREFFSTIAGLKFLKKKKRNILKYVRKLSSVDSVGFGVGVFSINFSPSKLVNSSLEKERLEIDATLKEQGKKLVVIIDDIDRLDKDETKVVFKIVKLVGNFPNTIYLLAYDRDKIVKELFPDEANSLGEEYLKKIIQVSFPLPEPDKQDLRPILFKGLDTTLSQINSPIAFDQRRWENLFYSGFKDLFNTVRDINRYINTLRLDWSIVGKYDVNPVDFMGVEALRVFAPDFYNLMGSKKPLFTEGIAGQKIEERVENYIYLLNSVPEKIRSDVDGICKQLFPYVKSKSATTSGWDDSFRRELRVCSREKFDFYFRLTTPTGAISEIEVKQLIDEIGNKKAFLETLQYSIKQGKIRKLLYRLIDYLDQVDKNSSASFILSLWDIQEEANDKRHDMLDFENVDRSVHRLVYKFVEDKIEKENRIDLIKKLVKKSNVLYPPVEFVKDLIYEIENGEKQPSEEMLLEVSDLYTLKKAMVGKIELFGKSGKLENDRHLGVLLAWWQEISGEEATHDLKSKLIKSPSGIATLLASSRVTVTSHGMSLDPEGPKDYVGTRSKKISRRLIEELYRFNEVEKSVDSISDDDYNRMNDFQREGIDLFRKKEFSQV